MKKNFRSRNIAGRKFCFLLGLPAPQKLSELLSLSGAEKRHENRRHFFGVRGGSRDVRAGRLGYGDSLTTRWNARSQAGIPVKTRLRGVDSFDSYS